MVHCLIKNKSYFEINPDLPDNTIALYHNDAMAIMETPFVGGILRVSV